VRLEGRRVVLTVGPTREHLDPVRFLTNGSTGAMGFALARAARRAGASVTVIAGPTPLPAPAGIKTVPVTTGRQMYEAARKAAKGCDLFIAAAAVSDWRFAEPSSKKLKTSKQAVTLGLLPNPDILKSVGRSRAGRPRIVVGFALETHDAEGYAAGKLEDKKADLIVANGADSVGSRESRATLIGPAGTRRLPRMSKPRLASQIMKEAIRLLETA